MGGPVKGRADFLLLGDYNAACSMCGRKRKSSELVRNWQGLYRCPEHNEPRQPQDFVRDVKDIMSVPWAQPEQDSFVPFVATFPAWALPASVNTATPDGPGYISPSVAILTPNWVNVESYQWSWETGGANIDISSPNGQSTTFYSTVLGASGVAQCLVTSTLGATATVLVPVLIPAEEYYVVDSYGNYVLDSNGNRITYVP